MSHYLGRVDSFTLNDDAWHALNDGVHAGKELVNLKTLKSNESDLGMVSLTMIFGAAHDQVKFCLCERFTTTSLSIFLSHFEPPRRR